MFGFKRFMIVDDTCQNHAMRSLNCKQIWRAMMSAISVAFQKLFTVANLRYQLSC